MRLQDLESELFVCLDGQGEPTLVVVGPVVKPDGELDQTQVAVFLDEEGPHLLPSQYLLEFLVAIKCTVIESSMVH